MRFIFLVWLLIAIATGFAAPHFLVNAQAPVKSLPLTPTEAQQKDLKLAQDAAVIATQKLQLLQQQVGTAEAAREQAIAALNAKAEEVRKENKWPDSTSFDPNELKFAPAKAAEKKP